MVLLAYQAQANPSRSMSGCTLENYSFPAGPFPERADGPKLKADLRNKPILSASRWYPTLDRKLTMFGRSSDESVPPGFTYVQGHTCGPL
ncbi:MAG: hypothetical protein L0154_15900, partial [Chloroflexi bacterium]|nr:hypothetical protein [Chloroflexota bacterium]